MTTALRNLIDKLRTRPERDIEGPVELQGFLLPPRAMRFCGAEFKDDAYFLKSARLEVKRLIRHSGLGKESRLVDIGCGPGRLAIGVLAEIGEIASYHGLDVHRPSIQWCTNHLARPHFRFTHVDVENERYNPGSRSPAGLRLPVSDGAADLINLYSVFSHMTYGDVVSYLEEIRRMSAAGGRVFLTAFVEENVPNFEINPTGYRQEWSGSLHCVRFERAFFEDMLAEHGFRVDSMLHGRETTGQSAYYLSKSSA